MKDSCGREINYLRISLTDRCNLRCLYCMPPEGIQQISHDEILRIEEVIAVVQIAASLGIKNIRFTGGEPLVRNRIVELVSKARNIDGIEDISLTTNGILLPRMARDLKSAGLNRVNISLDTLDKEQYRTITRCGSLADALAGIDAALTEDFSPIKINAVAIRRLNQDFFRLASMSIGKPLHMRFIEYMPVGSSTGMGNTGWGPEDVIPTNEIVDIINQRARMQNLPELEPITKDSQPVGFGPARYYRFPQAQGTVGFISPLSNHFCNTCNRVRLTADGKLRTCLFSDNECSIKEALRENNIEEVKRLFVSAISAKPRDNNHVNDNAGTARKMSQIGG